MSESSSKVVQVNTFDEFFTKPVINAYRRTIIRSLGLPVASYKPTTARSTQSDTNLPVKS